jgi:hypothetical protein
MRDEYARTTERLNGDVLKHLSTLKYLSLYRDYADVKLIEDADDWAVMSTFPTNILSYDTATYPEARKAVFLNGTIDKLKHDPLTELAPDVYLLRLTEHLDLSRYGSRFETGRHWAVPTRRDGLRKAEEVYCQARRLGWWWFHTSEGRDH